MRIFQRPMSPGTSLFQFMLDKCEVEIFCLKLGKNIRAAVKQWSSGKRWLPCLENFRKSKTEQIKRYLSNVFSFWYSISSFMGGIFKDKQRLIRWLLAPFQRRTLIKIYFVKWIWMKSLVTRINIWWRPLRHNWSFSFNILFDIKLRIRRCWNMSLKCFHLPASDSQILHSMFRWSTFLGFPILSSWGSVGCCCWDQTGNNLHQKMDPFWPSQQQQTVLVSPFMNEWKYF